MMTTVDVNEAKQQLAQLLDLARAGNEIVISQDDTPVARLIAIAPPLTRKTRIAGLHAGAVWTSIDFDEELPDNFWMGSP